MSIQRTARAMAYKKFNSAVYEWVREYADEFRGHKPSKDQMERAAKMSELLYIRGMKPKEAAKLVMQ